MDAGFDGFEGDGEVLAAEGDEVAIEVAWTGRELEEAEDEVGHFAASEVGVDFADGVRDEVVGGKGVDEVFVPRGAFGEFEVEGFGGDFHAFEVGDILSGAEFAVGESFDPAFVFGVADVFGVPLVFWDIGEAVGVVEGKGFGWLASFDDDFGDFGAVDAVVGAEGVFAVVTLDYLAAVECGDGLLVMVTLDVGEFGVGGADGEGGEREEREEKREKCK